MLAYVRMVLVAAFVSVAVLGGGSAFADEDQRGKGLAFIESTAKGVLGGALRWVADTIFKVSWDRFQVKACQDKQYRTKIIDEIRLSGTWINEAQLWTERFIGGLPLPTSWADALKGWVGTSAVTKWVSENGDKLEKYLKGDSVDDDVKELLGCDTSLLVRLIGVEQKLAGVEHTVDEINAILAGSDLYKIEGIRTDITELKNIVGKDNKSGMRGELAKLTSPPVKPTRVHRHRLVPCGCKSPETETNVWLNAWRAGS